MKKILIFTILFCIQHFAFAQVFTENKKPFISGTFNYKNKGLPDELLIRIKPDSHYWDSSIKYNVKIDSNGNFRFRVKEIHSPTLYSLAYIKNGKRISSSSFYLEPDDSIHVNIYDMQIKSGNWIDKDSLVFSGHGAAKNNVIESLGKNYANYYKIFYALKKPKNLKDSLEIYLDHINQTTIKFHEKANLLINNAYGLNSSMKKLLIHQFSQNYFNILWAGEHRTLYKTSIGNIEYIKILRENYFKNFNLIIDTKPEDLVLFSPGYFYYMITILKYKQLMDSKDGLIDAKLFYETIKNEYSGTLRERLLIELFKGAYGFSQLSNVTNNYEYILNDAKKYMGSPLGKEIINEKLLFRRGSKLFDADFIDLKGNKFNTSSLKGKIFLLEMWGEGCSVCAAFHKRFEKEIWPVFKDRQDFVVLSIFDGKSKERWLESIKTKLYTSEHYINISNLPLSSINHPFMKHYKVNYTPFLMLVDKEGKLISHIRADINSDELISLIGSCF